MSQELEETNNHILETKKSKLMPPLSIEEEQEMRKEKTPTHNAAISAITKSAARSNRKFIDRMNKSRETSLERNVSSKVAPFKNNLGSNTKLNNINNTSNTNKKINENKENINDLNKREEISEDNKDSNTNEESGAIIITSEVFNPFKESSNSVSINADGEEVKENNIENKGETKSNEDNVSSPNMKKKDLASNSTSKKELSSSNTDNSNINNNPSSSTKNNSQRKKFMLSSAKKDYRYNSRMKEIKEEHEEHENVSKNINLIKDNSEENKEKTASGSKEVDKTLEN